MRPSTIHIQHELNKIQHKFGYLPAEELKALTVLAESRGERLPLHRLHEVASFYPHYRLEKPTSIDVKVCRDMTCHLRGAPEWQDRLARLADKLGGGKLEVGGVSCLGQCDSAPAFLLGDQSYRGKPYSECEAMVRAAVETGTMPPPQHSDPNIKPDWKIDVYRDDPEGPTYKAVRGFVRPNEGDVPEAVRNRDGSGIIEALKVADLRGMGGAGVPAHQKWFDVQEARGDEKYIVVNADESEPGTFKDRELLMRAPHLVIEGVLLAGLLVGATKGYVYIRHEYHEQIEAFQREIDRARAMGACGDNIFGSGRSLPVEIYVSPGGYVCGEQSALIEAMEDKRSEPRNKPPELATNGLWDKPTLVSNVETFAWAPGIVLKGGAWYRDQGVNGAHGARIFSVSGDVAKPGVYEVPIGIPFGELLARCGGMRDGKALKAVAASGPSGGFLPAKIPVPEKLRLPKNFPAERIPQPGTERDFLDMELDLDVFRAFNLMLGAGIVVYAEGTDIVDQARNCTEFFRNESCGKCVPCRQGSERLVQLAAEVQSGSADMARLDEIDNTVDDLISALRQSSICGLGVVAGEPLAAAFQFFRAEVDRHARPTDHADRTESTR